MKVCIVGAGAIGGWIGVHLGMQPDVELNVLARGQTSVSYTHLTLPTIYSV